MTARRPINGKRPAYQFYPGDEERDTAVRGCSLAAFGLWKRMQNFMHECDPYGHLTSCGNAMSPAELARLVGAPTAIVTKLLRELETRQVFSRTDAGVIYCRRMVRDAVTRSQAALNGSCGGNPALLGRGATSDNASDNASDNEGVNPRLKAPVKGEGNRKVTPATAVAVAVAEVPKARRGTAAPWMGDIRQLWHDVVADNDPPKGLAKALAPLVGRHGLPAVLAEFRAYCEQTPLAYHNYAKFAAGFGTWVEQGGSAHHRGNGKGNAKAARLYALIGEHGLAAPVALEQHDATIDDLAARKVIRDAAWMKAALRAVAPWTWMRTLRSGDEPRAIERIAGALAAMPESGAAQGEPTAPGVAAGVAA